PLYHSAAVADTPRCGSVGCRPRVEPCVKNKVQSALGREPGGSADATDRRFVYTRHAVSAVAVVSIALVWTGVLYYEHWLVKRDARARARERWHRMDVVDPDYGRYLRATPVEPLARILDSAVSAGDFAVAYQR